MLPFLTFTTHSRKKPYRFQPVTKMNKQQLIGSKYSSQLKKLCFFPPQNVVGAIKYQHQHIPNFSGQNVICDRYQCLLNKWPAAIPQCPVNASEAETQCMRNIFLFNPHKAGLLGWRWLNAQDLTNYYSNVLLMYETVPVPRQGVGCGV